MGVVKGGPQLVENNPQPLGVILHLEKEVEKGINIVIINTIFYLCIEAEANADHASCVTKQNIYKQNILIA